mgnify:CR=1 FL=1
MIIPELKKKTQRTSAKFIGINAVTIVARRLEIKSSDSEYLLLIYQLSHLPAEYDIVTSCWHIYGKLIPSKAELL